MASKKDKTKKAKLYNTQGDLIATIKLSPRPKEIRFQGGFFKQDPKKKKVYHLVLQPTASTPAANPHSAHA